MSPVKLGELVECFGRISVQGYAATEAALFISVLDKSEHRPGDVTAIKHLSSAGRVTPRGRGLHRKVREKYWQGMDRKLS